MKKQFPSRINIIHLVESLDVGGMENGIVNLANNIDNSIFDFKVCCLQKQGLIASRILNDNVMLSALDYGDGLNLSAVFTLARLFHLNNAHIVHTHGWGARSMLGLLGSKLARVPVCINGEHGHIFNHKKSQIMTQKMLAKHFDGFLFVSKELKNRYINDLQIDDQAIENSTVIYNGVDLDKYHGGYNINLLKREFDIKDGDVLLITIGSLKRQKNQQLIFHACAELKKSKPRVKLLVVGDGPDKNKLQILAKDLCIEKEVKFLGVRHDLPEVFSLADVMISSSISGHEGLSNVILESMASKVPVIATRSTGVNELINDFETGLLCDDSPKLIAGKILSIIDDETLRLKLIDNAIRNVENNYSLKKMTSRYEEYYYRKMLDKIA